MSDVAYIEVPARYSSLETASLVLEGKPLTVKRRKLDSRIKEFKFCEECGVIFLRTIGSEAKYCWECV